MCASAAHKGTIVAAKPPQIYAKPMTILVRIWHPRARSGLTSTGRARPQMDIRENSRFGLTYYPQGVSPLETDHTYYEYIRELKRYIRDAVDLLLLISTIEAKCMVAL